MVRALFLSLTLIPGLLLACQVEEEPVVGAASSLRLVLPEVAEAFSQGSGARPPRFTYGASGSLARQLEAGAPLSGLILASEVLTDELIEAGALLGSSKRILANNHLVLAIQRGSARVKLSEEGAGKIALGDPRFVPAGAYAQETLEARGIWRSIQDRLIYTRDVSGAVALLRRGEVEGALIYGTDVLAHDALMAQEPLDLPAGRRPQIVAARAPTAPHLSPGIVHMELFWSFLESPRAVAIFQAHGFGPSARDAP